MHSLSSDAQEYFWASLGKTIFNVQLVNFIPFFLLFLYKKHIHAALFFFFSKGSISSARENTSLVKPHFQHIKMMKLQPVLRAEVRETFVTSLSKMYQ